MPTEIPGIDLLHKRSIVKQLSKWSCFIAEDMLPVFGRITLSARKISDSLWVILTSIFNSESRPIGSGSFLFRNQL